MEKQERGFHTIGGMLLTGTWWVHLVGFICTLLRIKIPYIPTPKQEKFQDAWKLSIPNILMIILSISAIVYGINYDWSPYSLMMAGFALVNILILSFTVLIGQQKFMRKLSRFIGARKKTMHSLRDGFYNFKHRGIFSPLRNIMVIGFSLFFLIAGSYAWKNRYKGLLLSDLKPPIEKKSEGFYLGIPLAELDENLPFSDYRSDLVSANINWEDSFAVEQTIMGMMGLISKNSRSQLLINWLPEGNTESENSFVSIAEGKYDDYLIHTAKYIQEYDHTVFINFAPEVGNPNNRYALPTGEYTFAYQNAWKHVFHTFAEQGISNVVWVWTPYSSESTNFFYPGSEYVDWVGVPYRGGFHKEEFIKAYDEFSQIFAPFPTLIIDQTEGKCQDFHQCSREIGVLMRDSFPEIQGWVVNNKLDEKNFRPQWEALSAEINKVKAFNSPPFIPEKKRKSSLLAENDKES